MLHPGLLILILLTAVTVFSGCEINKPEMPTFETALTIPLGVERVEILDVIEDEDFLVIGDDGGLSFFIDGDPDTMAFDFELSADIGSQTIDQGLGNFSLEALDPMNYSFELGQIWAPADGVVNLLTIVPAFPIDVLSAAQDIPDVDSATLTSGSITITLNNGLPVPVSADSGPDQLFLTLEDPGTGAVIATFVFPEVAGGSSNVQTVDLAGATLPGSVSVHPITLHQCRRSHTTRCHLCCATSYHTRRLGDIHQRATGCLAHRSNQPIYGIPDSFDRSQKQQQQQNCPNER